ncbi:hypothetical protein [Intrasporangium sp.]|uniref:hypothetical protein n=1 Tax=Intrasporangium sp. TaxID=1925024 RepID=UPI0033657571
MSALIETTTATNAEGRRRPSFAVAAGAIALLLAPITAWAAGTLESLALDGTSPSSDPTAFFAAIAANAGLWNTYGVLMFAMTLFTLAWVPAVWRLTVDRSPRWAWTAAVIGTLYAIGQMVHLVSWGVLNDALAASAEASAALAVIEAFESSWFFVLVFAPYLLGALLAAPLAAVALRRAQLLHSWSVVVIGVGTVAAVILGTDNPVGATVFSVLLITGFAPAVVRVLRDRASR